MNLTQRDKRAILVGVIVIVAAFAVRFAGLPMYDRWQTARLDIAAHRAALADIERRTGRLATSHVMLKQTYGDAVSKPLEDIHKTQLQFHKTVQDLLKSAGVAYTSIQPQTPRAVRDAGVTMVSLRVTGMCQLPQLTKCLASLREAEQLVIVERIDVTADEKKPNQLSLTLTLATVAEGGGS